ncbi:MAG: hypothetical protein QN122_07305 [Armatimonadota bacterium]|nr:hypothetical protein [Armatimonadota bacterium]MDR7449958.1 hypothetical protein [Armatimonadota bacterium]MDR7459344.1 hypothetical protein [Armatimonadota bacterium]MDR7479460.1 hypothetical protein [Armatimonadota bacterium]MDR7489797.1 hypothetical protein [Armatimonadota bacterium]
MHQAPRLRTPTVFTLTILWVALAAAPCAFGAPGDVDIPAPPPQVLGDGLIVPGQRVGTIRLVMSLQQILEAAGEGYRREVFEEHGIILYEWRAKGLWVSLDARTRAVRVISVFGTTDRFRTDKGITLMMPFPRAEAAYGREYRRWLCAEDRILLVRYPALGLQFGVVNDPSKPMIHRRIFQIGVFKPGPLPAVQGCRESPGS